MDNEALRTRTAGDPRTSVKKTEDRFDNKIIYGNIVMHIYLKSIRKMNIHSIQKRRLSNIYLN